MIDGARVKNNETPKQLLKIKQLLIIQMSLGDLKGF